MLGHANAEDFVPSSLFVAHRVRVAVSGARSFGASAVRISAQDEEEASLRVRYRAAVLRAHSVVEFVAAKALCFNSFPHPEFL